LILKPSVIVRKASTVCATVEVIADKFRPSSSTARFKLARSGTTLISALPSTVTEDDCAEIFGVNVNKKIIRMNFFMSSSYQNIFIKQYFVSMRI
jgi:hypothetical protein